MNVAIPVWNDMVSPVLDSSETLLVVTIENGRAVGERTERMPADSEAIAGFIAGCAGVIICGALSGRLERQLRDRGVNVHPWVMGPSAEVISSFVSGGIQAYEYTMPGCGRHRRGRCSRGPRCNRERKVRP